MTVAAMNPSFVIRTFSAQIVVPDTMLNTTAASFDLHQYIGPHGPPVPSLTSGGPQCACKRMATQWGL